MFFAVKSFAQTANAGSDKTVYLTHGNKVTIGGRSFGASYAWTKIYDVQQPQAGYPIDPAIITSPSSATTTVTGLIQGVWYYQLAVTTGRSTKKDTVVVRVDYDSPPAGSICLRSLQMTDPIVYKYIDDRRDTTQLSGSPDGFTTSQGDYFPDRARSSSMMIDSSRGKFYSTIEDGYHWQSDPNYARTEMSFGTYYNLDSNKTYCFEWKGYFPQNFSGMKENQTVGALMQVHGSNTISPNFGFALLNGIDGNNSARGTPGVKGLYLSDEISGDAKYTLLMNLDSMVNQTHTVRLTFREGKSYPGQDAFIKIEMDGVEKYYRNTGQIGNTFQEDYPKLATLYDYGKALVDPNNHTRNRKFSLVTESFKIYTLDEKAPVWPPVINTGGIEITKKYPKIQ